ncbi:hypothetical protein NIES2100_19770 [Calothrix sp. NIES-2100]|uniref:hypothetical protein n=1 Tax=Calothrix sp. NIES-2100 TaxID=1954172 RepID=UPI000B61F0AE|nr:hypothetical protein NIES2100_19770 [Calothrix sp. NIES-2100]
MGQQVKKVCQLKLGGQWKDGCCTDNPPVDNISLKFNALAKLTVRVADAPESIASAVEQSPIAPTKSQQELHLDTLGSAYC